MAIALRNRKPGLPVRPFTPLARTFTALTGSQVVGRIIRFAYLLVIARLLGPADTAVYLYGLAASLALGVVASFGQGAFLASRLRGKAAGRSGLVRHSLALRLISTALALALGAAFLLLHQDEPRVRLVLAIFLAAMVVRSLSDWIREWSIAAEETGWIPRFEVIFRGLEALLGSLFLLMGGGILAICLVYVGGRALEAVLAMRLMHRRHGFPLRLRTRRRLLQPIAAVSLALAAGAGCLALFPQVGVIALKQLAPDLADLAYFGVGMQFLMTLMVLPTVLAVAMIPAIGRVRRSNEAEGAVGLSLLIRMALLIGAAIAVPVDSYAPWFVGAALGMDFDTAGRLLADLVWILGPYAAAVLACQSLNALGAQRQSACAAMTMVALSLLAMGIFVPMLGLPGASLSVRLAVLAGCGLAMVFLRSFVARGEAKLWLFSLAMTFALELALHSAILPKPLLCPILLLLAIALSWRLKLVTHSEIAFVLQRFGIDPVLRRKAPRRI